MASVTNFRYGGDIIGTIVINKGIRDAGSTADFRILFEIFESLEIFDFFETFKIFEFFDFF